MSYLDTFINGYKGYANYVWNEVTFQSSPWWKNYFFWLLVISAFFWGLELLRPWRVGQPKFRKDFWLDFFYMFFNFFLFSLVIYNAVSSVVVEIIHNSIAELRTIDLQNLNPMEYWPYWHILLVGFVVRDIDLQNLNPMEHWPYWSILLVGFVVRDFVQWNVHRLLHYSPRLWEFHKVHHSVEQMGFAAHLRYHWMETLVYRTCEYLPLALLGIGLHEFFVIHIFTVAVGHNNHTNFYLPPWAKGLVFGGILGAFVGILVIDLQDFALLSAIGGGAIVGAALGPIWGYIFNSPEMHIWHHARELPADRPHGVNFGITLAIWDYIFGKNYIPHDGRDIPLGFDHLEEFPKDFISQSLHGFQKPRD